MDNSRPTEFVRRLVPASPRVLVPILYTNVFPEVFPPPSIYTKFPRPASGAATPAPNAATPALNAATPAPNAAAPAPGAAAPASGAAAPSAAAPASAAASGAAASGAAVASAPKDVPMDPIQRCPSPAMSELSELSNNTSMTSIESEDPTTPPQPRPRRWSLSGDRAIESPKKAPTKADVIILLRELYQLGSVHAAQVKYEEFRIALDNLAKAKLARNLTFTKQNPDKLKELYMELCVKYPWFARVEDGWPARPYLLDRQRNLTKRIKHKKAQKAHDEAEKVFLGLRASSVSVRKAATPISVRKTRSVAGLD